MEFELEYTDLNFFGSGARVSTWRAHGRTSNVSSSSKQFGISLSESRKRSLKLERVVRVIKKENKN